MRAAWLAGLAGKVLLALVTMLLLVVCLEIGVRIAGYQPIHDVYSKPSNFWQRDGLLGWSHEPGATGTYVGPRPFPIAFRTEIRIDSLGLRGPEVEPLPSDGYRILTMGDSYTAAFEVAYQDTFTSRVGEILNAQFEFPIQSINAGVRGYGTDQSYLYFRERGHRLKPDLVVFVHSDNDFTNNITLHRPRRPFGKPALALRENGRLDLIGSPPPVFPPCEDRVLNDSFEPITRRSWIDTSWCHVRMNGADHSALFSLVVMRLLRIPAVLDTVINAKFLHPFAASVAYADSLEVSSAEALTGAIIVELDREVRRRGADFLLLMAPPQAQRLEPGLLESRRIVPHNIELDAPVSQIAWVNDSHLTPFGHRLFAESLAPLVAARIQQALGPGPTQPH
ncbi:MAG: SGNH/GDSL hydrolase family protein [Myxococcota bacterium]